MSNVDFTTKAAELYKNGQKQQLRQEYGEKFLKKLEWFFTTVAKAQEVIHELNKRGELDALANKEYDITVDTNGLQVPSQVNEEEIVDAEF